MLTLTKSGLHVLISSCNIFKKKYIKKATSFLHPERYNISSYPKYWDGYLKFYDRFKNSFPVGMLHYVEKVLKENGIRYKLVGFDDEDVSWIQFSEQLQKKERDYQRESVLQVFRKCNGILVVPTRGGKTFIASECIRLGLSRDRNAKFVFVVDSIDLFNQAINDISSFLGIKKTKIGRVRGKIFEINNSITICTIQTIQAILRSHDLQKKKLWRKFVKTVGYLFVDEIHEYSVSKVRQKVIRSFCNKKYFISLSATPFKSENYVANLNTESQTGGVIYTIQERELVKRKVLAESKILLFLIERNVEEDESYKQLKESYIIQDYQRNHVIVSVLRICARLKLKTLALFTSKKHGFLIEELTGYRFIYGETDSEERTIEKNAFLKGKGKILLASSIFKKGMTLPECEIIFNVDGGKETSLVIQIRGRSLGTTKTKTKSLCLDFVDNVGNYFSEHSLNRIKAYEEKVSLDNIDMLDVNDKEFLHDVEQYFLGFFS